MENKFNYSKNIVKNEFFGVKNFFIKDCEKILKAVDCKFKICYNT